MTTRMGLARFEATRVTLALLAVAIAWDASGLDLPLARLAGSSAGFPLREHWLLSMVLHDGVRRLAWLLALALCVAAWWPWGPLARLPRGERVKIAAATLLAAFSVSLLKHESRTSCPWDLAEFGGFARYASHWSGIVDGGSGRCFPAGHASAGFSFVAGYFGLRQVDPAAARRWLAAALAAGLVLGLAQQWRGAQFMSHTLWTVVTCWIVALLVDAAWPAVWMRGSAAHD
jgi:membrane-associated PAP2 superfamily phosphatase